MKKSLRSWVKAAVLAAAAFVVSSCYYDPYYSSASASYSSGSSYGQGYGYGGSSFSTSVFVGTGNPQWGYDPYCYSYYDYRRRCYYDPYLHGYYPVGYRPPVVVGCPHPYGYRSGYCPPPTVVRNVTVVNYRNRVDEYRRSNYGWARQVSPRPGNYGRVTDSHPQKGQPQTRPNTDSRPSRGSSSSRPQQSRQSGRNPGAYGSNRFASNTTRQEETRGKGNASNQNNGRNNARTQENRGNHNQNANRKNENRAGNRGNHPNQEQKARGEETRGKNKNKNSVRYLGQG